MSLGRWKRTGFAAFFLNSILAAQPTAAPTQPRFDVVSIRAVSPNAPTVMTDPDSTPILPGGGYVDSRAMLHSMIAFAYNVPSWRQVIGLPNWAENQLFAVAAKPAEDFPALPSHENREQVRLMVRAMLADRFHLQLHTETRKEPVYNLEVAKAGIKIKEVDPPVPPAKEGHVGAAYGDDGGRMIGNKSTMAGMAGNLTVMLQRTVIDQTGLKGYYDFDVRWSSPDAPTGAATGFGAEGIALVISMLPEKFGLRLTGATGPEEYWVVDHIEPPTDN
jgi:uncharacterized protein (TIGR03435 family)